MKLLALAGALLAAGCVTVAPAPTISVRTAAPLASPTTAVRPTQAPQAPTSPPAIPTAAPTLPPIPTLPPPPTASTPTTAPSTDDGGTAGEKIEIAGFQYVTMAEAEWSESGYNEFFAPEPGNVMYAFLMEFEGIDPEGSSYNPFYFDLIVDGFEFSYSLFGKEPSLSSGDLGPGDTIRGWLTFEAPLADSVLLRYEPVLGMAGDSVEWTVTVNP